MKKFRYKLILGKFVVRKVEKTPTGFRFSIFLPGLGHLIPEVPSSADVREGDIITLYTEVLSNADPNKPPIQ